VRCVARLVRSGRAKSPWERTEELTRLSYIAVVSVGLAFLLLGGSPSVVSAAGTGQYGPPEWLPLRSSSDGQPYNVGCVKTNCLGPNSRPYHG
jgi:hypothetical protein